MHSFEKLMKAKTLLGIHEKATLSEIKFRYKNLMQIWHPDKHPDNTAEATAMSAEINDAYATVLAFCNNYEYRFDEEYIKQNTLSPQEWWEKRFGGR